MSEGMGVLIAATLMYAPLTILGTTAYIGWRLWRARMWRQR